jgi:hypothetical protein
MDLPAIMDDLLEKPRSETLKIDRGVMSIVQTMFKHKQDEIQSQFARLLMSIEKTAIEEYLRLSTSQLKAAKIKLEEGVLTKIDEGLFARKTREGKIEIFEVIDW